MRVRQDRLPFAALLALLAVAYAALLFAAACLWIWSSAAAGDAVLWKLEMARTATAVLIGVGLAVSGGLLQGVLRNDLVEPGLIGINAGGNLAATLAMLALPPVAMAFPIGMEVVGGLGAFGAAVAVYLLASGPGGRPPLQLVLIGVSVGAALSAASTGVAAVAPIKVYYALIQRQAGSLSGADWPKLLSLAPFVLVLTPLAFALSHAADVSMLGDETATGLGLRVSRTRLGAFAVASGLSGACVAVGGGISFVGLLAPHIARRFVGPGQRRMLLVAGLFGGLLMLAADLVGRVVLRPSELPAGLFVGLIGAPYLLYLLMTS
jgi:iron complex transport system permease protein